MSEKEISAEVVAIKILLVRGRKVMLDRDLAEMYGVKTKVLLQSVKRNAKRFPEDCVVMSYNTCKSNLEKAMVCYGLN